MIKGTTPTHVFTLPFDTEMVKTVQVIYGQGGVVKATKGNEDCTLEGKTVTTKLTQEETFSFVEGSCVEVQIRVLTHSGDVLASHVKRVHCEECLSDEVLT